MRRDYVADHPDVARALYTGYGFDPDDIETRREAIQRQNDKAERDELINEIMMSYDRKAARYLTPEILNTIWNEMVIEFKL